MEWILPLILAFCYEYYMKEIPWRWNGWAGKAGAFLIFMFALWIGGYRLRNSIDWFLEPVVYYGAVFFYLWVCHRIKAADCFYHVVILFLSTDCILQGLGHLSMIVCGEDYVYQTVPPGSHLAFVGLIAVLFLAVLRVVKGFVFCEKKQPVTVGQVSVMFLTLLPILYLTNIHQWLHIDRTSVGLDASVIRVVLSFCGLVAILGNESLYRSRLQAQELKSMEAMLHNQYEQYLMKKETADLIMQQCHDLKNQFRALQLSQDASLKDRYLEQLQRTIDRYDSLYQTGNETLDIILSEKCLHCRENNMDLICVARGELLCFMDPIDICTIFGNALDNAIESVMPIKDREKRLIQVKVAQENKLLVIRFENPYEHELNWKESGLGTTKADGQSHGYGLKGIRYAADKYGGHMAVEALEGRFALTVVLPQNPQRRFETRRR